MSVRPSAAFGYNLFLKSDLLRVTEALRAAGIESLVFKGIPLALSAYGGLAERSMWDNDLLVRRADVLPAHQILRTLGFQDRAGTRVDLSLASDFQHVLLFDHPHGLQTGLELHWHIYSPVMFDGPTEALFERAVEFELDGMRCLTLGPEDTLLQIATHWAQHGLNKPSILRDLAAVWTHVGPAMDMTELVARAKAVGVWPILCLAFQLLAADAANPIVVPAWLKSRRAEAFARVFADLLQPTLSHTVDESAERRLRGLSWLLLKPERSLASMRRELLPSHARLNFIAGRTLSKREALTWLWKRQSSALTRR